MRLIGCALLLLVAFSSSGSAELYERFLTIEHEEDLYELKETGEISEETFDALLQLFQRGVNLNSASRQELYGLPNISSFEVEKILSLRKELGSIEDPAILVTNGAITQEQLVGIAPFLLVEGKSSPLLMKGWAEIQTRWSSEDSKAPPVGVRAFARSARFLTVGLAATTTRLRVRDVRYDPNRDALIASAPSYRPHLAKAFAKWEEPNWEAIVGTYRIGFGQRLVFDNTGNRVPFGFEVDYELFRDSGLTSECKESAGELEDSPCRDNNTYVSPDYKWRSGLLGAAFGTKGIRVGKDKHFKGYLFGSVQPKSIYQYSIYDRGICDDPRDDDNPDCSSPWVFRRGSDLLAPTSRFSFQTLPNMYRETTVGGNATLQFAKRGHVGVTGYHSIIDWLPRGIDLDFQEYASTPNGGNFGAVGTDFWYGFGRVDLYGEVARSFDNSVGGGGGLGGIFRSTISWKKREIETAFRYYQKEFSNPYARPISASDVYDGLRARDEAGLRVKYTETQKHWTFRGALDTWFNPSTNRSKTLVYARVDDDYTESLRFGLWTQYQNKDIRGGSRADCFEVPIDETETGEPIECRGEKFQVSPRIRFRPSKGYSVAFQYTHELVDDGAYSNKFRQDSSAWVTFLAKPTPEGRFRARIRWLFEDIKNNERMEQSLWGYLDATYRIKKNYDFNLRYDVYWYIDDRASTDLRSPNPEHWIWLRFKARF